jgi:hypothetical protein
MHSSRFFLVCAAALSALAPVACSEDAPDPGNGEDAPGQGSTPGTAARPDVSGVEPTRKYAFLSIDGVGTEEEARAYYRAIGADESLTLEQWAKDNIGDDTVKALHRNAVDVGFWREVTCSKKVGRGFGGCMLRNWTNPSDATDEMKQMASVGGMSFCLSSEGVTQFFVFSNTGRLSTKEVLDSEGDKYVTRLCASCHGGHYAGAGATDLGLIWRELEPSNLVKHPAVSDAEAAKQWFDLNQVIRQANAALRTEAEGGAPGIDRRRAAMLDHLDRMYSQTDPPVARTVRDPALVPATWKPGPSGDRPAFQKAREKLWTQVVNPYCMGCHRHSAGRDFADYADFEHLGVITNGRSMLEAFIFASSDGPPRDALPVMPQSEHMSELLRHDAQAMQAIADWRTQLASEGGDSRGARPIVK